MIPCVGVAIQGVKYFPVLNNEAMFRLQDEFPPDALEQISNEDTRASFKLAFGVFKMLCEEGAAVRRHYGYDPGPIPDWESAKVEFLPMDIVAMRTAIYQAITLGYGRQLDEAPAEVDVWLMELEKKTSPPPEK